MPQNFGYNEFGYLNDDEYLKEPEVYTELESMDLYDDIVKERKLTPLEREGKRVALSLLTLAASILIMLVITKPK